MTDITGLPVRPSSYEDLQDLLGKEIGPTDWYMVTQERIDAFAAATGDDQWIHVDPERAAASPLGTTIAHGLNYGYDKVRFPAPLPSGTRVRMRLTLQGADRVPGGIQVRSLQVVEAEGIEKPVVVAEALVRIVE
ncbi:acyl dehydratase [Catenulispora sp. MAP12-49]|uniref:MaoC family dehydratase n=1 Tax=Catenulispora sp. MAP12-49 TaxID=3156302 RepID=UPI0035130446